MLNQQSVTFQHILLCLCFAWYTAVGILMEFFETNSLYNSSMCQMSKINVEKDLLTFQLIQDAQVTVFDISGYLSLLHLCLVNVNCNIIDRLLGGKGPQLLTKCHLIDKNKYSLTFGPIHQCLYCSYFQLLRSRFHL